MISIKLLIAELQKFPDDSFCNAYDGEDTGIVIKTINGTHIGWITARESLSIDIPNPTFPEI